MAWEPLGSANRLPRRQAPPWPLATFCVSLLHFVLDSCVTNYYQHGGLEQWNLFSPCSRGRKAKVRVSAELCFYWELVGENPSFSLSASGAFLGLWLHHSNLYIGILQRNKTCRMCVHTHTHTHTHMWRREGETYFRKLLTWLWGLAKSTICKCGLETQERADTQVGEVSAWNALFLRGNLHHFC